jgi:hypothetical protein
MRVVIIIIVYNKSNLAPCGSCIEFKLAEVNGAWTSPIVYNNITQNETLFFTRVLRVLTVCTPTRVDGRMKWNGMNPNNEPCSCSYSSTVATEYTVVLGLKVTTYSSAWHWYMRACADHNHYQTSGKKSVQDWWVVRFHCILGGITRKANFTLLSTVLYSRTVATNANPTIFSLSRMQYSTVGSELQVWEAWWWQLSLSANKKTNPIPPSNKSSTLCLFSVYIISSLLSLFTTTSTTSIVAAVIIIFVLFFS